jgi:alpha/beta superfamily hydrolase
MLPEGRYDLVDPPGAERAVLALHPHPDMGGDRHNAVVDAVFRAATGRGWAAIRPDLSSSDLAVAGAEAIDALELLPDGPPVAVVGYSFGAVVACGLTDPRITAWVLVAPPFGALFDASAAPIGGDARPKLLLVASHDQFAPPDRVTEATAPWVATESEEVTGADHFLAGATARVAERACDWIAAGSP